MIVLRMTDSFIHPRAVTNFPSSLQEQETRTDVTETWRWHSSSDVCVYVFSQSFQSAVAEDEATPDSLKNTILSTFEPLHKFHTGFLREVEQRMALWWGLLHVLHVSDQIPRCASSGSILFIAASPIFLVLLSLRGWLGPSGWPEALSSPWQQSCRTMASLFLPVGFCCLISLMMLCFIYLQLHTDPHTHTETRRQRYVKPVRLLESMTINCRHTWWYSYCWLVIVRTPPLKLNVILQSTVLVKNTFKSVRKYPALHVSPAVLQHSNSIVDMHLRHCDHIYEKSSVKDEEEGLFLRHVSPKLLLTCCTNE